MNFVAPPVSILATQKAEVLATAAQLVLIPAEARSGAEAARAAAVDAVSIHWRRSVKRAVEMALGDALENYQMIEGDFEDCSDAAGWHAGLAVAAINGLGSIESTTLLGEIQALIMDGDLQEPDRIGDVADNIAALVIENGQPGAKDVGKFLGAAGIVKVDLDELATHAPVPSINEVPSAETVKARVEAWKTEATAAAAAGTEIPSPPAVPPAAFAMPPPAAAVKSPATPDKASLGVAYRLLYEQSNCDPDVLSAALGFSRSTIMNYMTGRTAGKASAEQARILVNDIHRRRSALNEAEAIFSAVV